MIEEREKRFWNIVDGLTDYHYSFNRFAKLGILTWDSSAQTAEIRCYPDNRLEFAWNPHFFETSSDCKNQFIFLHETLHMVLEHFKRSEGMTEKDIANMAADISINHMLCDDFNFVRENIEGWSDLCWRDTVIKGEVVPKMDSFEGYYQYLLDRRGRLAGVNGSPIPINIGGGVSFLGDTISDLLGSGHSLDFGGEITKKIIEKLKIKKETLNELLKYVLKSKMGNIEKSECRWGMPNRKYPNLDIPVQKTWDKKIKRRKNIAIYCDVSGSCSGIYREFIKFSNSLDKNEYCVDIYGFDTSVNPIKNSILRFGGGGTDFKCVAAHAQSIEKDAVFVITDGKADSIQLPKDYKTWFWFISDNGISDKVKNFKHVYHLKNYVLE